MFLPRKVGRKEKDFVLYCVKNHCKGGNVMDPARKLYLDNIRWMTVVLVVIYHVVYMFNGVQPFGVIGPFREHQLQDCFQYLVYPWFMALLFVVSGMSARYYLQSHTTKQFLKDKTRKLLVPSTIGLFVFQWLLGIYNLKIGGGLNIAGLPMPILYLITVLSGVGPLWYIQMLWLFSMLLLVVRKIEKDRVWNFCSKAPVWSVLMLTIIVYGSAQVLNTPVVTVYRFGIYGFCFFAGYFLFSHEEVMERLCKWWWMFDAASAVLGISYTVRYFGENYAIAPVLNNIHACVYCWFAILGILTTMKNYADISTAFTHWMAKKSWGLYIFHYRRKHCLLSKPYLLFLPLLILQSGKGKMAVSAKKSRKRPRLNLHSWCDPSWLWLHKEYKLTFPGWCCKLLLALANHKEGAHT